MSDICCTDLSNRKMLSLNSTVMELETSEPVGLLDQARDGDTEAFCELCRVHEARLLRQATALCRDATLAQDLAQDTLVEAWKSLHRYSGRCRFFTWLCAILLNRYRNTLRARRPFWSFANSSQYESCARLEHLPAREARPDQALQLREQAALVRQCVQALPLKHQQVILLRFYVDDSLEGIAAALGCSVGTVKSRLFHALDKLRAMKAMGAHFKQLEMKDPLL
ncbi:MAG TPA: sigma-70 family RNA polymerase sigma factor [Candidatus Binatia bacterium]|nr:sigma-70 family RNA polymerase sigma factor [Candidatus Binatia bacterium]